MTLAALLVILVGGLPFYVLGYVHGRRDGWDASERMFRPADEWIRKCARQSVGDTRGSLTDKQLGR